VRRGRLRYSTRFLEIPLNGALRDPAAVLTSRRKVFTYTLSSTRDRPLTRQSRRRSVPRFGAAPAGIEKPLQGFLHEGEVVAGQGTSVLVQPLQTTPIVPHPGAFRCWRRPSPAGAHRGGALCITGQNPHPPGIQTPIGSEVERITEPARHPHRGPRCPLADCRSPLRGCRNDAGARRSSRRPVGESRGVQRCRFRWR